MLLSGNQLQSESTSSELLGDVEHFSVSAFDALNFTDYMALSAPHVAIVQAVLSGKQSRYKLRFENAVLLFDHGCLMGRVFFGGHFYALPPIELDALGLPYLRALPIAQRSALAEFCSLPKGILLFYFTLLKQVFGGRKIYSQWIEPRTMQASISPIPMPMRPWLQAVGWPYASEVDVVEGCSVS